MFNTNLTTANSNHFRHLNSCAEKCVEFCFLSFFKRFRFASVKNAQKNPKRKTLYNYNIKFIYIVNRIELKLFILCVAKMKNNCVQVATSDRIDTGRCSDMMMRHAMLTPTVITLVNGAQHYHANVWQNIYVEQFARVCFFFCILVRSSQWVRRR